MTRIQSDNIKVSLVDVHKNLGGKDILTGVNLDIHEGESIVIIGQSGSGKSVTLRHMIALMEPDRGMVLVDGEKITSADEATRVRLRSKFGMLFQGAALFDSMNVLENVGFMLYRYTDKSDEEIREIVKQKLALVGLRNVEEKKPSELSGGMKKRVGLARAIALEPEIILYDEPTTGLDPITADIINDLIIDMRDKLNVTSIVVTHDMTSAYKVGERIAMLYKGKIIYTGLMNEVQQTRDEYVRQFIEGRAEGPIDMV